jgi:hypothetical protein
MIVLSGTTKERVYRATKAYWLSPFCAGTIEIGETLLSWALEARALSSKAYADAYSTHTHIAYQIKTGLPSSPVTFARLTTLSQFEFVNDNNATELLGRELLAWVRIRIEEPMHILGAQEVRVARLLYTRRGDFTYYERISDPNLYLPEDYHWQWSSKGNALEGYREGQKCFSWYPQGRRGTKNQNQLHYHGENLLIPSVNALNRFDFTLGEPAQIEFDALITTILALLEQE